MKPAHYPVAALALFGASFAWAADVLITVPSAHDAKTTMDRLEAVVKQKGMNVFARIDHAAGAAKVGKQLRPTEVLIFGNPQGGTPLMLCAQTAGIDLPLKALAWQDNTGKVWLGYNDPVWLAGRHQAGECGEVAQNISKALAGFAQEATRR
ncbi:MAG: DUF302 domain-containing protein [Sulfuricaulis sp.]|uniref:DUF302 domain-containing protein n=1 Tax=Sulfuricaulis sp. TaxID=2003553 RepID=UPI0034A0DBF1